ncbi:MAG: DeoR/GlpR family DNA-binding transcription regulator [Spirochaetota bacterium]
MEARRERLNKIMHTVRIYGTATVRELSEKLKVSHMTIRRDLNLLVQENVLRFIHGGVAIGAVNRGSGLKAKENEPHYSLRDEESVMIDEKKRIARFAASLIEAGDIIIVDGGSTTGFMSDFISDDISLTVICYALNILTGIRNKKNCKIIFPGGYFHEDTLVFESPESIEFIKRQRANKAFISARAVNATLGVTTGLPYEVAIKKAVLGSSLIKILLVDSSKFGRVRATYFADLKDFDVIITDTGIPDEYMRVIQDLGIAINII